MGTIFALIFLMLNLGYIKSKHLLQRTIREKVECIGVGLHTGEKVRVVFYPKEADYGIRFKVVSKDRTLYIDPSPFSVVDTSYATCIGSEGVKLCTVEHVLGVIRGLSIDNLLIEVHGSEMPIMDGSGICFVKLFKKVGIVELPKYKRFFAIKRPFLYKEGKNRWIKVYPYRGFKVKYTIMYDHPLIKTQEFVYEGEEEDFIREIAGARTFGFLKEVDILKQKGLIKGGSLENAVVFDQNSVLNKDGFRFKDEPVRHKILDFIGDISLIKYPLIGYFEVFCSGHSLNNLFLRVLYEKKEELLSYIDLNQKRYKILFERFKQPLLNVI